MAVGDFYTYTSASGTAVTHIASTVTATYIITGWAQSGGNQITVGLTNLSDGDAAAGIVVGGGVVLSSASSGNTVITVLQLT